MYSKVGILVLSLLMASMVTTAGNTDKVTEPYRPLSGKFSGKSVDASPDPLVNYRWTGTSPDDDLEIFTIKPEEVFFNGSKLNGTDCGKRITVDTDGDLMLDFGQVNAGWLEFDCDDMKADVTCSISEFNEPARLNAGAEHPDKTAAPVKYGKTFRLELNRQLYEGVRYAWIHLKGVRGKTLIKNVRLVCQTKPVNYEGSFMSNSDTLNRIWYTAAYTVRLNLLKDYFGAILMERSDRHSWTGDAHTSQAAALVAFGNYDFVRKNIFYTSEQFNGIESYSLYWVQSLIDYFDYTADRETVLSLTDNACNKLDRAYGFFDNLPSLSFYGWDERLGAGFERPNVPEMQMAFRGLAIQTWRRFARMMEQCGKLDLAARYRQYASEKTEWLRRYPGWYKGYDIFAMSDVINAGVVTDAEKEDVWRQTFSDRLQRVSYSPFNQYFVINAMARLGRHAEALNTIDDCWGGQIRYGATTFFEVFRPSWNFCKLAPNDAPVNNQCGYTSFTHPWSSGVLKWLSEEVLGVRPVDPGFAQFAVQPHLTAGLTSVSGTVPTPHGKICFDIDTRKGEAHLTVPPHTSALLALPLMGTKGVKVTVDGKEVQPLFSDATHVFLPRLEPGEHRFALEYTSEIESPVKQEPLVYAYNQNDVKIDRETRGNWVGKYGRKGYVLFGFDEGGAHRMKLPAQCRTIELQKDCNWHDDMLNDTLAALIDPYNPSQRKVGGIITGDPAACMQTFTIDVDYRSNEPCRLSVYMADPTGNRRSAIELFDMHTNRLLLPVQMVRNYKDGQYITFTIDRAVRLRICQVRGDNAVCPALFFD